MICLNVIAAVAESVHTNLGGKVKPLLGWSFHVTLVALKLQTLHLFLSLEFNVLLLIP